MDELSQLTGKALLEKAGCNILAEVSDPAVEAVIKEKGWPTDKPVLLGAGSDSVVRPAMFVVHNGLHTEDKVAMYPIDFMNDLATPWYITLTGGKKEVPAMIVDGFVVGEAIGMLRVLQVKFGVTALSPKEAALIDSAQDTKGPADAMLKHFGFCKIAAGAKPYRNKGALSGEGLAWVQENLKKVHEQLSEWEEILKNNKFLGGEQFGVADCASAATAGSLYHITEAPIDKNYPNVWRWYQEVKQMFVTRSDWDEIKKTGCGFFKDFENFEMFMKVVNVERRTFACCGGREALSNPTYWAGVNDVVPAE